MSRFSKFAKFGAAAAAAVLLLSGCAGSAEDGSNSDSAASASGYVTEGKITFATSKPAYAPWVLNDDPASGEGLEAAVAVALAKELGFEGDDVVWVREQFDASIAPGPKTWDLNFQQFSVTEERKQAVDFSNAYYTTTQAVVAAAGTSAAKASSIADLKDAVIGVQSGTTSLAAVESQIAPNTDVQVFNSNEDAVAALQVGQIDALVVDLPSAYYVRDVQLEGEGVIVGQLVGEGVSGDDFAFVLPKGSKILADVNKALENLRNEGTLDELAAKWLANLDAPILK
ncbi:ABC transporter substrate-binding protein [Canibacter zhoujuaniae]|uniref:ABC transporter substrate-binding protein n=1 Tax=Canibacter zhoujuaniae TaxID=2708343 RepID=UPI0014211CB6|nr:ABC transporter substrate-binding protein [Canibacter zhoujuaniae]